jgi:hypothetical protein
VSLRLLDSILSITTTCHFVPCTELRPARKLFTVPSSNRDFQTLINGAYALVLSFMSFEMSLAEIVITIPTIPTREGITNYTPSYWFVIVVVLIPLPQNLS